MNTAIYLLVLLSCGLTLAQVDQKTAETKVNLELHCFPDLCALMREFGAMQEKLGAMERRLADSESQLAELKTKDGTKVVFSASAGGSGDIGPFHTDITFIYRAVITNIGNAYNKHTGIFTAPIDGVYYFTFFYHAGGKLPAVLLLYKNNQRMSATSDHTSTDGADNGGNGVTLQLTQGDQVYVRMRQGTHVWGGSFGHTTFSGFLLHLV